MSAKRASADGLLGGIIVETPATRRGSRYAWIPIEAFRKLSAGGLKLFALLSGLHRPRKALALSVSECAASLGCCERSLRYWRRELEREGWLEPGCLTIRRANRLRKGYRARVDVTKLAVMSPASLRAYVAVTFATRDGVRQRTYEAIAKTLGRSRQALWAALKPVRLVGIALADRARSAIRAVKQVTASTARGRGDRDVGGWKRAATRLLQAAIRCPRATPGVTYSIPANSSAMSRRSRFSARIGDSTALRYLRAASFSRSRASLLCSRPSTARSRLVAFLQQPHPLHGLALATRAAI